MKLKFEVEGDGSVIMDINDSGWLKLKSADIVEVVEEEIKQARLQTLQEAIEIGDELKKRGKNGYMPFNSYNQAITDFQGRLKEKMEEK